MESLVKMDPQQKQIAEEFDQYHSSYEAAVNDSLVLPVMKADFFTRVKADYFLDILESHLGPTADQSVLDVGAGVGVFHPLLQPKLKALAGCDVSEACLRKAELANPRVAYKHYDGSRLPYDDNSFDAALTVCVMHHVPPENWAHFTAEMARVVRPGGLVAVFEHNPRNPLTMRVVNRCPFDEDAVLLKSNRTFSLLENAGLDADRPRFILSIPALGWVLRRLEGTLSWLRLGAQYYAVGHKR